MRLATILFFIGAALAAPALAGESQPTPYAGSVSCRECHERFYQLWSASMHGLAMQPYTPEFAKARLTPQKDPVTINRLNYRADIDKGVVVETGAKGEKSYRIEHVLGGKNVCYFLTPLDKGRLQTLPLAYDVNKKEWFDTAASGLRHFPGGERSQAVDWKDSQYTFNTACYGCHVSQLSTNYDPQTDTYNTTWAEPGINCETCHGSAVEHNGIARATPKDTPLTDLRIIRTKTMTNEQRNDLCSSCHAKGSPLTLAYQPGERFFDHFDLATLEDADFYPDGRDLGENYTYTSWRMSPCVKSGKLDCMHCHTSSGRYRFKKEKFNDACVPCHEEKVNDPAAHTHHHAESEGSRCISCHMPKTAFARMNRSDHSMAPPAPAATIAYQSPNACNICHADKDAAWADALVRQWRTRDYQAPVLAARRARRRGPQAGLDEAAGDARRHQGPQTRRGLRDLADPPDSPDAGRKVLLALLVAAKDKSPLVRGAAVQALGLVPATESLQALIEATADEYRLVRVRAAAGIAAFPRLTVPPAYQAQLAKAEGEYLASITARPDQWTSHYNLGNYRLGRGETREAIASFEKALAFEPQAVMALVNSSIAHARLGEIDQAEKSLQLALELAPDNAAANFNMGLLKAEKKEPKQAESYLKKAIAADPQMAQAAHNLCIMTAKDRVGEAVAWCRKAAVIAPQNPAYAYTLAFYLNQKGEKGEAVKTLEALLAKNPGYRDAEMLLEELSK